MSVFCKNPRVVTYSSEQKSFPGVTESQQQHSGPRFTGAPEIPKKHYDFRKRAWKYQPYKQFIPFKGDE